MGIWKISLDVANVLYVWGLRASVFGALVTFIGGVCLYVGTRVRDHYSDAQMTALNVEAGRARERAGKLEVQAAGLEKETAALKLGVADANARAKEAELELVKFRTPRRPNEPQLALIAERLKPFAGTKFDVGLSANSGEQADFIWTLEMALANFEANIPNAGWIELAWGVSRVGEPTLLRGRRPQSGSVAAQNVEIHLHPESREKLLPAANALIAVLNEIGITARDAGFNAHSTNVDAIHILIGDKR